MIDTPITKKFYKKLELYLELRRQNKRVKKSKSERGKITWSMEKAFLLWAVRGHWHLGTPLTPEYVKKVLLKNGFSRSELRYTSERQVAQNLVFKKFAYFPENQTDKDIIQITDEGFMMGEVIEETNSWLKYVYLIFIGFVWLAVVIGFFKIIKF